MLNIGKIPWKTQDSDFQLVTYLLKDAQTGTELGKAKGKRRQRPSTLK